jgi:hypothetical protein
MYRQRAMHRTGRFGLCPPEETHFEPPGRELVRSVLLVHHAVVGPKARGQDTQTSVGHRHSNRIGACVSGTENVPRVSPKQASGQ